MLSLICLRGMLISSRRGHHAPHSEFLGRRVGSIKGRASPWVGSVTLSFPPSGNARFTGAKEILVGGGNSDITPTPELIIRYVHAQTLHTLDFR